MEIHFNFFKFFYNSPLSATTPKSSVPLSKAFPTQSQTPIPHNPIPQSFTRISKDTESSCARTDLVYVHPSPEERKALAQPQKVKLLKGAKSQGGAGAQILVQNFTKFYFICRLFHSTFLTSLSDSPRDHTSLLRPLPLKLRLPPLTANKSQPSQRTIHTYPADRDTLSASQWSRPL